MTPKPPVSHEVYSAEHILDGLRQKKDTEDFANDPHRITAVSKDRDLVYRQMNLRTLSDELQWLMDHRNRVDYAARLDLLTVTLQRLIDEWTP